MMNFIYGWLAASAMALVTSTTPDKAWANLIAWWRLVF